MSDQPPERDDEERPEPPEAAPERKTKKERVLHTRVPAILEQELKNLATSWRMPVSNVVRAILEDAIDTVDRVGRAAEGELLGVAQRLSDERARLRNIPHHPPASEGTKATAPDDAPAAAQPQPSTTPSPIAGAIGFTAMVLANDVVCPVTGEALRAGEQAYLVMFLEPGRHAIVSPRAVPKA